MGQLQPHGTHSPPQHGAGQEATRVPRIYRRARNDPHPGADAHGTFHCANGPIPAAMAVLSGAVKSAAGERAVQLCVDIAAHIIAPREVPAPTTMDAAFEALHALHVLSPDLANSMKKAVG